MTTRDGQGKTGSVGQGVEVELRIAESDAEVFDIVSGFRRGVAVQVRTGGDEPRSARRRSLNQAGVRRLRPQAAGRDLALRCDDLRAVQGWRGQPSPRGSRST